MPFTLLNFTFFVVLWRLMECSHIVNALIYICTITEKTTNHNIKAFEMILLIKHHHINISRAFTYNICKQQIEREE